LKPKTSAFSPANEPSVLAPGTDVHPAQHNCDRGLFVAATLRDAGPASGRLAGCRTVTVPASKFPLLRRCRKDRKAFLRALLYPGRFCYSWMTGFMGSNDDAVAFLAKTRPARLDLSLITRALRCRHADADPDVLFPARTRLPSQVDACATLLAGVPLAGRSNARGRR